MGEPSFSSLAPAIPPAPWRLRGEALFTIRLVSRSAAQALLPRDVDVVCVWPDKTIAVLYLARYAGTPVGEYRELIVAPALTRVGGRLGFWVSHIIVDSAASVAAGRSIWALPKNQGVFRWSSQPHPCVQVSSAVDVSVEVASGGFLRTPALPFIGAVHSRLAAAAKSFTVRGSARASLVRATIRLSGEAALQKLRFDGSMIICRLTDLRMTIGTPKPL
jgi:acetoacetate decarboxylase